MANGESEREFRTTIDIRVGFRKRGYRQSKADIKDISTTGFLIDTIMNLSTGEEVWLSIPGLESIPAKVVRIDGYEVGCEFERKLNEAVLDNVIAELR